VFANFKEIDDFVEEHGIEHLRDRARRGLFHPSDLAMTKEWLREQEAKDARLSQQLERRRLEAEEARGERALVAAEVQASAARRQADAAEQALRLSRWALVLSVVAIIVAAVAYLRPPGP
jgi:hypothetical protein